MGGAGMGRTFAIYCHGLPDIKTMISWLQPILPDVWERPHLAEQTSAYDGAGSGPFPRGTPGISQPARTVLQKGHAVGHAQLGDRTAAGCSVRTTLFSH